MRLLSTTFAVDTATAWEPSIYLDAKLWTRIEHFICAIFGPSYPMDFVIVVWRYLRVLTDSSPWFSRPQVLSKTAGLPWRPSLGAGVFWRLPPSKFFENNTFKDFFLKKQLEFVPTTSQRCQLLPYQYSPVKKQINAQSGLRYVDNLRSLSVFPRFVIKWTSQLLVLGHKFLTSGFLFI